MQTIILASNSENKIIEISQKLKPFNINVISQAEAGYNIEVDETGTTFRENAILKAEAIYEKTKMSVISDDSGLEIDALGGKPGVYSKRFAGENATDNDRIEKILDLMKNVEDSKRTARFICAICYIDKFGEKHIFEEACVGKITTKPYGDDVFGYDPIFLYDTRTFAQMTREEKNEVSHRGKAINSLVKFLKED